MSPEVPSGGEPSVSTYKLAGLRRSGRSHRRIGGASGLLAVMMATYAVRSDWAASYLQGEAAAAPGQALGRQLARP